MFKENLSLQDVKLLFLGIPFLVSAILAEVLVTLWSTFEEIFSE